MKNVCINPFDDGIKMLAVSLKIVNEFKMLGFLKFGAVYEMVIEKYPEYDSKKGYFLLSNYWNVRVKDAKLNELMLGVLDNIKNE